MKQGLFYSSCLLGVFLAFSVEAQSGFSGRNMEGQQAAVLTGQVLNDDGKPVAGAVVSVASERNNEASTNSEGVYVLRSAALKPILRVNCAGYEESEQPGSYTTPAEFRLTAIPDYQRQLKKRGKAVERAYRKFQ